MQLGFVATLAAAGLWIWVAKGRSESARNSRPITGCLALGFALLIGSFLLVRPALGQVSAENRSPHPASERTVMNHLASPLDARLILRVYNYARIAPGLLGSAERVAGEIFDKVGVATAWVDCGVSPAESQAYPACQLEMGPADLVLRILPQRMASKLHTSEDALGVAHPCPESEPACDLSVFYPRVEKFGSNGYRVERILGYVIAHEVAHVLIGAGHSHEGIMRANWSPNCLQRMSLGVALDFTKEQSRELRYAVERRARPPVQAVSTEARLMAR